MSNNDEMQNTKGTVWIKDAIDKEHLKYYKYEDFSKIEEVGSGGYGRVSRAEWKNLQRFALKSFSNFNDATAKEVVRELKLQRKVDFHSNIIRFHGITEKNPGTENYTLVMEYADGGNLRNYLKKKFNSLDWYGKYQLAYQLACAVLCLHVEGIVHRDLHSRNVLVHQNAIKLADFGLSKRIEEVSNSQSEIIGMAPYVDPRKFISHRTYSLNEKSDVYSVGILLWEISSGNPPFYKEKRDINLILAISEGKREKTVLDTPDDYVKLYTECWNSEPNNRPTMHDVVKRLRVYSGVTLYQEDDITDHIPNENLAVNSEIIQKSSSMKIDEIRGPTTKQVNSSENLDVIVNEIFELISMEVSNGSEWNTINKRTLDYLKNRSMNSQEFYNWLLKEMGPGKFTVDLNNQNNSNSICLLGYFNYVGVGIAENNEEAFRLFDNASKQDNELAQYFVGVCYQDEHGIKKDEKLAFKYFKIVADKGFIAGQNRLGYCYERGIGIKRNIKTAVHWYEKAESSGNIAAAYNLGLLYRKGDGIINKGYKDYQKAFELFKKSSEKEYLGGITMLGYCYSNGIGTNIDKQKAIELYKKAADLGHDVAQYNLAITYKKGDGVEKDIDKAIYWCNKSANQGYRDAQNQLKKLNKPKREVFFF